MFYCFCAQVIEVTHLLLQLCSYFNCFAVQYGIGSDSRGRLFDLNLGLHNYSQNNNYNYFSQY